jgi:MFS family permease
MRVLTMKRIVTVTAAAVLLLATLLLYFHDLRKNPPGLYLDEASIALNALSIARDGVDEHGTPMPFYFRAFGEYKNPVYVYLLAGVFKAARPSVLTARRFSAFLCWLAAVAIGVLAWRITRKRWMACAVFLLAALTPAIFEVGRLVFEVALYPLVIALFLLVVHAASQRARWNAGIVAALVMTLALVEYTYSAGRMLAPLFAAAVAVVFFTRERLAAIVAVLVLFVCTSIVPVLVYNQRTGGGLLVRASHFNVLGSLRTQPADSVAALERNFVNSLLPVGMVIRGDQNSRHHVPTSGGSLLAGTMLLAIAGAVLTIRTRPLDRWWTFVLAGTFLSVLPCAIATDVYHSLRLSSYIVFMLVLSIRALSVSGLRPLIATALVLCALQPFWFFRAFHRYGPQRWEQFNTGLEWVTLAALPRPERPIYVLGHSYAGAFWYGGLNHVPKDQFAVVNRQEDVPPRSIYITDGGCPGCEELARHHIYSLQRTP